MDEGWDLFSVVRSYSSATNTNNTNITASNYTDSESENPLACLASLTFEDEDDPFSFPGLAKPVLKNSSGELHDCCKPFLPSNQGIFPAFSAIDLHGKFVSPQQQQNPLSISSIQPSLTPITTPPVFLFGEQTNQQTENEPPNQFQQQQQQQHNQAVQRPAGQRPLQSQAPRSRKRKNQQKKTISHVTSENLSADMWAWRKYGQKPIKGSTYPRNYYKCSSSKGCAARKHVERSNVDGNIFIVSYTGDHKHPRPTHLNSLAGSTRNKVATTRKPAKSNDSVDPQSIANNASSSSPLSTTSLSPTTPSPIDHHHPTEGDHETMNNEINGIEDRNMEMNDGADHMQIIRDGEYEEDDILIPNLAFKYIDEDIFAGLQVGLGNSGSGAGTIGLGGRQAFGNNFSSWGAGSSTTAGSG